MECLELHCIRLAVRTLLHPSSTKEAIPCTGVPSRSYSVLLQGALCDWQNAEVHLPASQSARPLSHVFPQHASRPSPNQLPDLLWVFLCTAEEMQPGEEAPIGDVPSIA